MRPVPAEFGEDFLEWLREETERGWAKVEPRRFEDFVAAGVGGAAWVPGTRWGEGLSEDEIASAERKWSLRFPPDYRLFLHELHAPDRPMSGARFLDGQRMSPVLRPSFFDWRNDDAAIADALAWPFEGLRFDLESGSCWMDSWGPKPEGIEPQLEVLRSHLRNAAALVPICGHRYLVGEPLAAGNPVLSVHQSDIIVYGVDLRSFLLNELSGLLGIKPHHSREPTGRIPFWSDLIG